MLALILVFMVIFVSAFHIPFINCYFVQLSDFQSVDNKVYCSPGLDNSTCDSLKNLVSKAIERNNSFWGIEPQEFTIIFCATESEQQRYAGRKDSQTLSHLTPFGTYIVLGKKGYNIDIISHEMSHSVLLQIVGYKSLTQKIPTWFNEGLALQVDHREFMMDSLIEKSYETSVDYLLSIADFSSFHSSNWDETRKHYLAVRYELKQWLCLNYNELGFFLNGIKEQQNFTEYYFNYKVPKTSILN